MTDYKTVSLRINFDTDAMPEQLLIDGLETLMDKLAEDHRSDIILIRASGFRDLAPGEEDWLRLEPT